MRRVAEKINHFFVTHIALANDLIDLRVHFGMLRSSGVYFGLVAYLCLLLPKPFFYITGGLMALIFPKPPFNKFDCLGIASTVGDGAAVLQLDRKSLPNRDSRRIHGGSVQYAGLRFLRLLRIVFLSHWI